jgi:hypothetical protein
MDKFKAFLRSIIWRHDLLRYDFRDKISPLLLGKAFLLLTATSVFVEATGVVLNAKSTFDSRCNILAINLFLVTTQILILLYLSRPMAFCNGETRTVRENCESK